jgi:enediyne biosynthesis protein E4
LPGSPPLFGPRRTGKLDIFFTNGAKLPELKKTGPAFYNCLLRNKGNGAFEDVTRKAGLAGESLDYNFGVAAGDYDNDGYEDLFVCSAGRNALSRNHRPLRAILCTKSYNE